MVVLILAMCLIVSHSLLVDKLVRYGLDRYTTRWVGKVAKVLIDLKGWWLNDFDSLKAKNQEIA